MGMQLPRASLALFLACLGSACLGPVYAHKNFKVCPFLAHLIPKTEGVHAKVTDSMRSASSQWSASNSSVSSSSPMNGASSGKSSQPISSWRVVATYPDLARNKAIVEVDSYYKDPWTSEISRTRWAAEQDFNGNPWTTWTAGSFQGEDALKEGNGGRIAGVRALVNALRQVTSTGTCRKLHGLLQTSAHMETLNTAEFFPPELQKWLHHHGHHHHDEDQGGHVVPNVTGRDVIKLLCEEWASRQTRHISMQFIEPEHVYYRMLSKWDEPEVTEVVLTGFMDMKTSFSDEVIQWPGALKVIIHSPSSESNQHATISQMTIYPLEANKLYDKWNLKYGKDAMESALAQAATIGRLVLFFVFLIVGVVAIGTTFFLCRKRQQRTVQPVAATLPTTARAAPTQQQQPPEPWRIRPVPAPVARATVSANPDLVAPLHPSAPPSAPPAHQLPTAIAMPVASNC